ncbi:hypothetical protein MTO96_048636 [Rhipicephalus appendiculatus]
MAESRDPGAGHKERPMITYEPEAEVKATQTTPHASTPPSAGEESPPAEHKSPLALPPTAACVGGAEALSTVDAADPGAATTQSPPRKSATVADVTFSAPERKETPPPPREEKLVKTGMYYALFGPTVQDLAVTMDVDLFHVLFVLAARGVGYFFGAISGGVLLRPVNQQVLLVVLDFFLAMACLGVSYFSTLFQSELLFGLGGFALGAINIVGVLWISAMWREASGFLLQTLSFMHCMGCALAPVLAEPYLTQRSVLQPPSDMPPAVERELAYLTNLEDKDFVYVAYAYWAVALYVFVVVFLLLVTYFVDPRHQDLSAMETQCPVAPCGGVVVVLFLYLFVSVAMEIIYSQLIAAFALLLGYNKTVASYLTSAFWAAFTTVRGVSMIWLQQHGSFNVLLLSNVFLAVLTGFNSVFGHSTRVLWIGTAVAGACMAPVMPSTLLLLHDYSGVSRSRFALAVLVVGASSAFAPIGLGAQLERVPMLFHYLLAALAAVSLLLVLVGRKLVRRHDGYIPLKRASQVLLHDRTR